MINRAKWKRLDGAVVPALLENQFYQCNTCGSDKVIPIEDIEWAYREERSDDVFFGNDRPAKREIEIRINATLLHTNCPITEGVHTPFVYATINIERRVNPERRKQ